MLIMPDTSTHLDSIVECSDGAMDPAGAAVARDVLVHLLAQEAIKTLIQDLNMPSTLVPSRWID